MRDENPTNEIHIAVYQFVPEGTLCFLEDSEGVKCIGSDLEEVIKNYSTAISKF